MCVLLLFLWYCYLCSITTDNHHSYYCCCGTVVASDLGTGTNAIGTGVLLLLLLEFICTRGDNVLPLLLEPDR